MLCKNCGTAFEGNFCPKCGVMAEKGADYNKKHFQASSNFAGQTKKKSHWARNIIIIIIALIVVDMAISAYSDNKARKESQLEQHYITLAQSQTYYGTTYKELFKCYSTKLSWACSKVDSSSGIVTVSGNCYDTYTPETAYTFSFYVSQNDIHLEAAQCFGETLSNINEMNQALYTFLDNAYVSYEIYEYVSSTTVSNQDFSFQIWYVTWEEHDFIDKLSVEVVGEITNASNENQRIFEWELFQLNNDGIIADATSDNYNSLSPGVSMELTLHFSFSINANRDFSRMDLTMKDGDTINLGRFQ